MAQNSTPATWVCRMLLGAFAIVVVYVASYPAAWSIAVRTRLSAPISWAIYEPIPSSLKMRMLRAWMRVDRRIEFALTG